MCKPSHSHNLLGVVHVFVGTCCQGHRQNVLQSRWLSGVALPKAAQVPEFHLGPGGSLPTCESRKEVS